MPVRCGDCHQPKDVESARLRREEVTVVARIDGSGAASLMERHQEHYRACNCLGDSDVCCVPDCECHGVTDA